MPRAKHNFATGLAALTILLCLSASRVCSQSFPNNEVPLFQYAVFYNLDLDMSPGSAMTLGGPLFCNSNIWCYPGGQMTFNGTVIAAGTYHFNWDTNGDQGGNISGSPLTPNFKQGQPISGAMPVTLSISITNAESLINLPPAGVRAPQPAAYLETNQPYYFNAAGLIISNSITGTNSSQPQGNPFTVYFQDSFINPTFTESNSLGWHWVQLTNDLYYYTNRIGNTFTILHTNYVPNFTFAQNPSAIRWTNSPAGTNTVFYAGFSFLTNISYTDYRESATVQAVQVDVGKCRSWLMASYSNGGSNWNAYLCSDLGQGINSIYVYNDVPFIGQKQLPAVCLVNGALLPNATNIVNFALAITRGLTVVTPQPLYVVGNYNVQLDGMTTNIAGTHNTASTYPGSLFADAITVLSSNWWSDWTQSSFNNRNAVNTTVNAACFTGIVPSTGGGSGSLAHYSGGIENYFRLLEDWSGCTNTFNGSMAAMFPGIYATNYWQLPQNYYDKPVRNWAYDTNFNLLSHLPPLTPLIINSNAAPVVAFQPTNETVLAGQTTNFIITASGVPAIAYQWAFHGTNISWGTNASFVLTNAQLTNAGNYTVQITNVFGALVSSNATLSVYTSAVPAMNALAFSTAAGLQFTVSGVPGFNYAVLASTNLVDWTPLVTNNSPFNFADTNAASYRFYRSVYLP